MCTWSPITSVSSWYGHSTLRTSTPSARYSSIPPTCSGLFSRWEKRYSTKPVLTGGVREICRSNSSRLRLNVTVLASSSAHRRIVRDKGRIPEIVEVEPIVRGQPRKMRQPVGEPLHDVHQRRVALLAVARQLAGETLEVQVVTASAPVQAEGQHHRHV